MKEFNKWVLITVSIFIMRSVSIADDEIKPNLQLSAEAYRAYQKDLQKQKDDALDAVNSAEKNYSACMKQNKNDVSKCSDKLEEVDKARSKLDILGGSKESAVDKRCDIQFDTYNDDYKECRVSYENMKDKCTSKSDLEVIDNDTMQATAPLMSMLSGADAILDIYGAMNENPQCSLSREDFKQERDSIKTDIKDIENQISDKTKEMQDAQEKYSEKLNEWADREREILDELNKIPVEKEKNRRKLDDQKVKMKIEAESKYNAVIEQMNTMTAEYNAIIQDQKGALYQASDFAMYDTCNMEYEKRAKASGTTPVSNGLSGAFYNGNLKRNDKVNYMANCLKIQKQNAKRVETAFVNKLNSIKQKLESFDKMKGQIEEERKLADQAIAKDMQDLEYDAATKAASLQNEYKSIQDKKVKEQALLNQKLSTLKDEIAKLTRQASILKLRVQHYSTKAMPKNSDKAVKALVDACEGIDGFKRNFLSMCCDGRYQGKGATSLCTSFSRTTTDPKPAKGAKKAGK